MASATGSHPDTGSSVRPLPGSSTTLRPATGRRFSAPKMTLLTERGFAIGCPGGVLGPLAHAGYITPSDPRKRAATHPVTLAGIPDGDGVRPFDFGVDVDLGVDVLVLSFGLHFGLRRDRRDKAPRRARAPVTLCFLQAHDGPSGAWYDEHASRVIAGERESVT